MFVRKPLEYNLFDLIPYIDEETMYEHYDVHYKKYTDNMNKAIYDNKIKIYDSYPLVSLIYQLKNYKRYSIEFRNNGGGYINHMIYFENLSPQNEDYTKYASDNLKNMIDNNFGEYDNFVQSFKKEGNKVFGSGWVWLLSNGNKLSIVTTANQDNPLMYANTNILLGMDVWEHAYYLKHKANRIGYINDFFNIIDWSIVSERLKSPIYSNNKKMLLS